MQSYTKIQDIALVILRLIIAAIFINAGWAKLGFWSVAPQGTPAMMVNVIKFLSLVEPLGGVALIAGFLTRWAAKALGIIMIGAILVIQFVMHVGFMTPQGAGWSFPLAILGGCIALVAFGGGAWSVDAMRKK